MRSRTPPVAPIKTPGAENRQQVRTGIEVFIDLRSEHAPYTGFSQNISEGGVFVATYQQLVPKQQVELRLHLAKDRTFEATGEVVWVRGVNQTQPELHPGAGIRFLDLGPEEAAQLDEYLAQCREPIFWAD